MRSKHYLVLLATGLSIAGIAACGSDANPAPSTGGSGTTTSATTTTGNPTSGPTSGPTSSSTGAGGEGDGNDTFETAEAATVGTQITGEIAPDDDADYFKFAGKKGMKLSILAGAVPDGTQPPYHDQPDIVVTLFDSTKTQIAENDDPIPRPSTDSQLNTVLPADGDYYLRVTDFCFWTKTFQVPPGDCGAAVGPIIDPAYTIDLLEMTTDTFPSLTVEGAEPNDDAATALATVYGVNASADYYVPIYVGKFDSDTDVDVYKVKVPADATPVDAGHRVNLSFDVYPNGDVGNGSTAKTGDVWLTTAADPTAKLAQIDATQMDPTFGLTLSASGGTIPIAFGADYLLFVKHAASEAVGTNPFYFLLHSWGGGNPQEQNEVGNDLAATAEALTPEAVTPTRYFISGDIAVAGVDVDYFSFDNDMSGPNMYVTCSGQRAGSGLRGMKVTLFKADGVTPIDSATEAADTDAQIGGDMGIAAPADAKFVVKVEAPTQDPNVSLKYYICGMGFLPAP